MITIAIANSVPLIAQGIQHCISELPDVNVAAIFPDFEALESGIKVVKPELLLFDGGGAGTAPAFSKQNYPWKLWPEVKTLLIHTESEPSVIKTFFKTGIYAYLLRSVQPDELRRAIRVVGQGGTYVQSDIKEMILDKALNPKPLRQTNVKITKREIEVIELIVEEYTTQEIADKLFVSLNTVETHRKSLLVKLGVKNSAGLVREALKMRLCKNFNF